MKYDETSRAAITEVKKTRQDKSYIRVTREDKVSEPNVPPEPRILGRTAGLDVKVSLQTGSAETRARTHTLSHTHRTSGHTPPRSDRGYKPTP